MVDFSTKNEGTWFYFDESNQELGGVCLRELSFEEAKRIDQITTKVKRRFEAGKWVEEKKTDEDKSQELTFAYCIVDWKNISLDGHSLECNIGNKVKAMKSLDFTKFILDCLGQLRNQNSAIDGARLKNSESISNGSSQSQIVTTALDSMENATKTPPVNNVE